MMKFLFKAGVVALMSVNLLVLSGCGNSGVGTSATYGTSSSITNSNGIIKVAPGTAPTGATATAAAAKAAPPAKASVVSAK